MQNNQTAIGTTHASPVKEITQSCIAKSKLETTEIVENNPVHEKTKVCDINIPLLMHQLQGYNETKRRFFYLRLMFGFKLHCHGPRVSRFSKTHKSSKERPQEVLKKLQKELQKMTH